MEAMARLDKHNKRKSSTEAENSLLFSVSHSTLYGILRVDVNQAKPVPG